MVNSELCAAAAKVIVRCRHEQGIWRPVRVRVEWTEGRQRIATATDDTTYRDVAIGVGDTAAEAVLALVANYAVTQEQQDEPR